MRCCRCRSPLPLLPFLLTVLLSLCLMAPGRLDAQIDVIRGRVTSADGSPLFGVRVTATSIPGNVTRTATTNGQGAFQIAFPGAAGDYMMGYALVGFQFRQFEIKRLADEDVLVADARLAPIQLDTITTVASTAQRVSRNSSTPDVGGTERAINASILPVELQGDIAAMAASLPGVLLVPGLDGGADGFSVLGLGADQNSVTLNGMEFDSKGLPRDAAVSTSLTTSPYDASKGGFAGGQFNIRSGSGSNFRSRGMSLVGSAPQLMWTDRAARAVGSEYTNVSLGGVASGPIRRNKSFYNVSYQLGRQLRPNASLLTTNALGLQTAGVSYDSLTRFLAVLQERGVPTTAGPSPNDRTSDNGSVFGSVDFSPPNSQSGSSYSMSFNGNWGRQRPVGGGVTQLMSASGDRINWGFGVQGRHNAYVKMLLTETTLGVSTSRNYGEPYLALPAGRVRVNSTLDDGASGVQTMVFGGNPGLDSRSSSLSGSIQNTLSWFDSGNKHRLKLGTELRYSASESYTGSNLLGTWTFNSLEELEAGLPASFTRQLTARERSLGQLSGALSIGDSWRRTPNVQFQYGLRVDGSRAAQTPEYNPVVEALFGRRNDHVPTAIAVSPRIGFSWTRGTSPEIGAFSGAARNSRSIIRGGIGLFANAASGGLTNAAVENTGLPRGVQQISCVGSAAPAPEWQRYLTDPSRIPASCADGTSGTVFSNAAPNVVLFAPSFRPQRSVRSNLSWSGSILDARYSTTVDVTHSVNLGQQRQVDLNFDAGVRFTLPDEASRAVFVNSTSIVPTTGFIASRDARISQAFQRVTEYRSDLRSETSQLSLRLSPIIRTPRRLGWNAAYTYTHVREQYSGFTSTAHDPMTRDWSVGSMGPHQLSYGVRYNFFDYVTVSWNGQFRSGSAFTPMITGDVNGDGYSNDRAFVYDPAHTGDAALGAQMQQLLDGTPASTRQCLRSQMGRIADRNSCRGPWSSNASLNITLDRVKFRMPQRAAVQFSLSNPLGAADLALHGSGRLKGWGQSPFPDQALYYVRGFDPVTKRYRYEVNQRFGATRPQLVTLRAPVTLTVSMRYDLGATRERQSLQQQLDYGRRMQGSRMPEASFRSMGSSGISNPMSAIIRAQDSLQLTTVQADSIAVMNRRYAYRTDSLWSPVARFLASMPADYSADLAYDRYLKARHAQLDLLLPIGKAVRDLLTPEQLRKLPVSVTNWLDPRFLASIRNGNGMYVRGNGDGGRESMMVFDR